jgi:L-lactate dehydrogenase complex protein LldE
MHIGGGLSRLRAGTRTVHLAEILASQPHTPQPHTPQPHTPQPHTPERHTADQAGAR